MVVNKKGGKDINFQPRKVGGVPEEIFPFVIIYIIANFDVSEILIDEEI